MNDVVERLHALSIAALLALITLASPATAGAKLITFDFEEYAIGDYYGGDSCFPPCAPGGGVLVDKGFVLDPGLADWSPNATGWIGHYHITDGVPSSVIDGYNGTKYFAFDYFLDNSRLNVYGATGDIFGVRRFDLAEGRGAGGPSDPGFCNESSTPPELWESMCGVTFIGHLADGGIVSRFITLDGIHDGVGPLTDFETISFDGRWNRLTMFSIIASNEYLNLGLDNLVLRVPEPTSLALLGLGLASLAFTRRRKH